jgi:hypothetical protein
MLVLNRFLVPAEDADSFGEPAARALAALRRQPGFLAGRLGRAADEPRLWVIVTEWAGAGYWRRALSAFDVRMELTPLTAHALNEPGAFESLLRVDGPPDAEADVARGESGAAESERGPAGSGWRDRSRFGSLDRGPDRAPDASRAGPGRSTPGAAPRPDA